MTNIAILEACHWLCLPRGQMQHPTGRGVRFQLCYILTPTVYSTPWQTCGFLSMLCSVSSWEFCKWCSLSWFISLDVVFYILQVFAQMSPVDFCCLSWAASSSVLPGHIIHASIKVLLITTSIGSCVCYSTSLWTPPVHALYSVFLCSPSACSCFWWA